LQKTLEQLREEYARAELSRRTLLDDPFAQFRRWFDQAMEARIPLANGMTLATVSAEGQPSARNVLLKDLDARGFVFYTNRRSRKGRELAGNPRASLCFWWVPLERQVCILGTTEEVSDEESDGYFATRPRDSNLSAMASNQSEVVASRAELDTRVAELREEWKGKKLARPAHWGGYRVVPSSIEFWQGRLNRLHDRFRYRREGEHWVIERLAP